MSSAVDPANRPFAPQYPLWSDGAAKRRWVRLPDGATIDTRDLNHWDFPVGTRFWKEFEFGGRKVETRLLVKTAADWWEFASYAWTEDQHDAVLAARRGYRRGGRGRTRQATQHPLARGVPRLPRLGPHRESSASRALQLSTDRDPLAPHAEAVARGHGDPADAGRRSAAGAAAAGAAGRPAPHRGPRCPGARRDLGYPSTNCGSCHNPKSSIASLGLLLQHSADRPASCAPDAITTTVGQPGHWVVPTAPEGASQLVHAGRPELSAVLQRAKSRRPSSQMPPIGTVVADCEALELVSAWITAGPGAGSAACGTRTSSHPLAVQQLAPAFVVARPREALARRQARRGRRRGAQLERAEVLLERAVRVDPGIGTMSSPCASSQASASWAGVQPLRRASSTICSTNSRFFSKLSPWKRG